MADLTLGSDRVLRATICLPRRGVWYADLVVDTDTLPSGPQTLAGADGAVSLTGTVTRGELWQGRCELRLVGGAAGLPNVLPARFYRAPTLGVVLRDIARECGETLSSTIDPGVLNTTLANWTRADGTGGSALDLLAERLGKTWRVLQDGTLWVGDETWPNVEVPGDVLEDCPPAATVTLGTDTVYGLLAPGSTWLDRRVSYVEHQADERAVRTKVMFEADPTPVRPAGADRLRSSLDALVRSAVKELRYHALYPAAVVSQEGDGTLTVQPDAPSWPPMTGLPMRHAAPGELSSVAPGARCLVGFEGGDPEAPYVAAFAESGSAQTRWTLRCNDIRLGANATRGVARLDDEVTRSAALATWMDNVQTALSGLSAAIPAFPPAGVAAGSISSASDKARSE